MKRTWELFITPMISGDAAVTGRDKAQCFLDIYIYIYFILFFGGFFLFDKLHNVNIDNAHFEKEVFGL